MDRIHSHLEDEGIKYRVSKNTVQTASVYTKSRLDQIGFDGDYVFGLWIVEPTGQTIQIGGVLSDKEVAERAPSWDPNWCQQECDDGIMPGTVDPTHIYGVEGNVKVIPMVEDGEHSVVESAEDEGEDDMYIAVNDKLTSDNNTTRNIVYTALAVFTVLWCNSLLLFRISFPVHISASVCES